jgi:hypothetical protein
MFKYKVGDRGICYTMKNTKNTFTVKAGPLENTIVFHWDYGTDSYLMSENILWNEGIWGFLEKEKEKKEFNISKFINSINKGEYSGK